MRGWDKSLKSLVADCPRAFVELVLSECKPVYRKSNTFLNWIHAFRLGILTPMRCW
jgi:hypothetical protein